MQKTEWFEEIYNDSVGLKIKIKNKIFSQKSDFQQVDIYETFSHGKMLTHDGLVMATEKDEHIYHEMIAHVPLFTHPNPKKVLIIGGGDGGTLREVLRHESIEKCVMVEIDPLVVKACEEHLNQTSCEFKNPKAQIIIDDGVKFAKNCKETFDVAIIDSSDPIGPATPLFNENFYKDIFNLLNTDGIVTSQCESPYYHFEMQKVLLSILNKKFKKTHIYNYSNQSYPSGYWSFSYASKGLCPFKDLNIQKVKKFSFNFKYYNEDIHRGAFMLPNFMRESLVEFLSPLPEVKF